MLAIIQASYKLSICKNVTGHQIHYLIVEINAYMIADPYTYGDPLLILVANRFPLIHDIISSRKQTEHISHQRAAMTLSDVSIMIQSRIP